jgi:hypothetical protein
MAHLRPILFILFTASLAACTTGVDKNPKEPEPAVGRNFDAEGDSASTRDFTDTVPNTPR